MTDKPVRPSGQRTRVLDAALLLATLVLGCGGSWYLYNSVETTLNLQRTERMGAAGQAVIDAFDVDLNRAIETVRSAGLMIASQDNLRREEFLGYANRAMAGARGFSFLEWQPVVPAKRLAPFEATARASGLSGFRVTEMRDGVLVPVSPRDEYVPVLFAWPESTAAMGVDMGFDAARMASKYMARDAGRPVASEAFRLISEGKQAELADAFAISSPVYRDALTLGVAARRKSIQGYIAGVIQIPELLREASDRARSADVDILVFDRASEPRKLIFAKLGEHSDWAGDPQLAQRVTGAQDRTLTVQVATRAWEIVLHPQPAFFSSIDRQQSRVALISGLLATLALCIALYWLQRSRSAMARSHAAMVSAEAALREERHHLANVLDGTNAGTWEWNVSTGDVRLNDVWLSMLGYARAELVPLSIETWRERMHPDDFVRATQRLDEHFSGKQDYYRCEFRMRHKAGRWIWIAAHGRLFSRTPEGQPEWIAGTHIEISEQKRLTQSLVDLKSALDSHAIVAITDRAGKITHANDKFCEISEYAREQLIGKDHRIINSGTHAKAFFVELWQTICSGQTWRGQICNRAQSGRLYWVDSTIAPIIGADGKPESYIAIRYDITEAKQHEERLLEAKNAAELAALAKSQFLANMSHEIRTPMNAILGMLTLLTKTDLSVQQLDYTSKTEGAAKSLLGLLNDILDFSKIDAGKMTFDPQPFGLDQVLRDLSVILSANVGAKPIEVLFDVDPVTPKKLIGDAMRLQQVLLNLSSNAIKFTAQGEVIVRIKLIAQSAGQARMNFSVSDTGIGIVPEHQQHIFDGFSQAEASTTRRFGGTGLGLSISKKLVDLMGGELSLQSVLGQGSTFSFTISLPLATDSETVNVASSRPHGALDVLVVDDNDIARNLLVSMAKSWGWSADSASSGAAAIAQIEARSRAGAGPYQAILLDWQMPGMDGWETIARIREHAKAEQPPITVMVTAHGREMLAKRSAAEQAQLHAFLVKPITASMLFDAVASAQSGHRNVRAKAERTRPLAGLSLLVVEDNKINQQIAFELLSDAGAHITLADNGELGVAAVAHAVPQFDAVLMDVQMPVMDGYEATRAIRQDLALGDLPIIAMTANAMALDREACLAVGMNDHVGKPIDLPALIEVVLNHTKRAKPASAEFASDRDAPSSAGDDVSIDPSGDIAAAIARLGGNTALYVTVLKSYLDELTTLPDQFDALLNGQDISGAAALLHTLKGLSGTVGASAMQAVAQTLESRIKNVDAHFLRDDVGRQFRDAVASTRRTLAHFAG